jgi:UDP-glucose 4-epimerase
MKAENKLKFLVTGGAGYIGGTVTRQLLAAGHEVVVYDDLSHGRESHLPPGAALVRGRIGDAAQLDAVFSGAAFDGVLHFAALIEAGESMREPGRFFENNTSGTTVLLNAMVRHGVQRFVFSSTAAVFGNPESVPIQEDARKAPTNAYGESKLLVERMLPWYAAIHGLRYAVLRYFNVAGALPGYGEAHEPETHLIPLILDVALGKRASIKIFGTDYDTEDGTCIRDYIHVADIGRAHLLAMDALTATGGEASELYFNLGNGRGFSVRQVVDAARRVTGHAIPVVEEPRRPGDPARLVASSAKIQHELGWQPEVPELDDILRSAWQWHQQKFGGTQ